MATNQETKKTTAVKTATKATTATKSATTAKKVATAEPKKEVVANETKLAAKKVAKEPMVKITLVRSTNGALIKQKRTIEALGLRKIRSSVVMKDNACTRGMIYVVKHLVTVEEVK